MRCWNSAFNAQGSRGITVAVHVGAVKIYPSTWVVLVLNNSNLKSPKLSVFINQYLPNFLKP